ncbi:MAG: alpha/beta fold hydrolase [Gemmatimonadaceae bacterium]
MATFLGIAVATALAWVVITTLWLWRHQERVVFQPPGHAAAAPTFARRLEFTATDGHPLYGYLLSPRRPGPNAATLVIAFHGNADLAAWMVPWAGELAERAGVRVFVPEYRGYGGIDGTPSYLTAASDAAGAVAFASRTMTPDRVVLFGHSLGSALASDVAAGMPAPPASLVLQSPFTSAREMAFRMLVPPIPWLWRKISRVHYDTRAIVASLSVSVWVSHGARDVVIPARMGRQVFLAARQRGELLVVEGAGHNDVADLGGERYWRWLTSAVSPPVGELEEERDGRLPRLM